MQVHALWPRMGRACMVGVVVAGALVAAPAANANVTSDVNDFNLTESLSYRASYTTTSSSGVQYRWLDSPSKTTYVYSANCATNGIYGGAGYGAGNTSYQTIGSLPSGWCFNLLGQTAAGSGSMFYYDGRVSR